MGHEDGKLRIYADANVLMAGAAGNNEHAAPHVCLVASEITLIDLVTTEVAIEEARRNVEEKVPDALPEISEIVNRSLKVLKTPDKETEEKFFELADKKDAIHLAGAVQHNCRFLITYNLDDYDPGHRKVMVIEPGELVARIRTMIKSIDQMAARGIWIP